MSIHSQAEEQYIIGTLDPSRFDIWIGFSTLVREKVEHSRISLSFNIGYENININMSSVPSEMQQDLMSS